MELGEIIKAKRKEKKLTQRQLGKIAEVNFVQICNYENGKVKPTEAVMERLARHLEIPGDFYSIFFESGTDVSVKDLENSFDWVLNNAISKEDLVALQSLLRIIIKHNIEQNSKRVS